MEPAGAHLFFKAELSGVGTTTPPWHAHSNLLQARGSPTMRPHSLSQCLYTSHMSRLSEYTQSNDGTPGVWSTCQRDRTDSSMGAEEVPRQSPQ